MGHLLIEAFLQGPGKARLELNQQRTTVFSAAG